MEGKNQDDDDKNDERRNLKWAFIGAIIGIILTELWSWVKSAWIAVPQKKNGTVFLIISVTGAVAIPAGVAPGTNEPDGEYVITQPNVEPKTYTGQPFDIGELEAPETFDEQPKTGVSKTLLVDSCTSGKHQIVVLDSKPLNTLPSDSGLRETEVERWFDYVESVWRERYPNSEIDLRRLRVFEEPGGIKPRLLVAITCTADRKLWADLLRVARDIHPEGKTDLGKPFGAHAHPYQHVIACDGEGGISACLSAGSLATGFDAALPERTKPSEAPQVVNKEQQTLNKVIVANDE